NPNKSLLIERYKSLKLKLKKDPLMMDFINYYDDLDPFLYVKDAGSLLNFSFKISPNLKEKFLNNFIERSLDFLKVFSLELNNGKRVYENILLLELINDYLSLVPKGFLDINLYYNNIKDLYNINLSKDELDSIINNLNFGFHTEKFNKKIIPLQEIFQIKNIYIENQKIYLTQDFISLLDNKIFIKYLLDSLKYSIWLFNKNFKDKIFEKGFFLYEKYSRKDIFRILNWEKNPLANAVGGYILDLRSQMPVFINFYKDEKSINYNNALMGRDKITWVSKPLRGFDSKEIKYLLNFNNKLDYMPLFIRKYNSLQNETQEFFYMGKLIPIKDSIKSCIIYDKNSKEKKAIEAIFRLDTPIEEDIFKYLVY
ncbi:MAG: DUF3427 domain-containing protein, partial [Psittacicella sp.]